ncbi:hypothetical protein TNCV_4212391 [Trichonephila clavipes]|nr:hypothetical protein TNCV_4212391 [Trichonephila clavipes]
MYGSTCADMQTTSGCFYQRSNHWEVGGRPQCQVWLLHSIDDFRDNFKLQEHIRGSVVVVHEEPHSQMTGTLFSREIARHTTQAMDDRYRVYRGQKSARWWSVCTTPCTVCTLTPAHRRRRYLWCREHRN